MPNVRSEAGAIFRCGSVEIHRVMETLGPAFVPKRLFPESTPDMIESHLEWLSPNHYCTVRRRLVMGTHSWVLKTGRHTVVVDTCVGNQKRRPGTPGFDGLNEPYLARLAEAGVRPEDVDYVLCTHLHADHVGWNTQLDDGRWVPTFPRAAVVCSRRELERARRAALEGRPDTDDRAVWFDSILPVLAAGLLRTVEGRFEIEAGLRLEPAPGHTAGNAVVWVESGAESALFAGDVCHHPLQVYYPDLNSCFCADPGQARSTRMNLLAECARRGTLLVPAHWGAPFAGRVLYRADGFAVAWPS